MSDPHLASAASAACNERTAPRFEPPQCPHCGAPTRGGLYYNEALVEETGKRVAAEASLQKYLARQGKCDHAHR